MKIIYIVNLIFGNWKLHGDQIVNRFKEDHNCKKIKSFIMHSLIKNIIQKKKSVKLIFIPMEMLSVDPLSLANLTSS